jgi:hypothetical protein
LRLVGLAFSAVDDCVDDDGVFIAPPIARAADPSRRKQRLVLLLIINFGSLRIFKVKYFNFFVGVFLPMHSAC